MTVLVALTDSAEGNAALDAGESEASQLNTPLVVLNLSLTAVSDTIRTRAAAASFVEREGADDRDPTTAVLDLLKDRPDIDRLVIGVKKRSRVGKALLGSISQQLILQSPVPVLAVKPN